MGITSIPRFRGSFCMPKMSLLQSDFIKRLKTDNLCCPRIGLGYIKNGRRYICFQENQLQQFDANGSIYHMFSGEPIAAI